MGHLLHCINRCPMLCVTASLLPSLFVPPPSLPLSLSLCSELRTLAELYAFGSDNILEQALGVVLLRDVIPEAERKIKLLERSQRSKRVLEDDLSALYFWRGESDRAAKRKPVDYTFKKVFEGIE